MTTARWDDDWAATDGDPGPARVAAEARRHHPDDDVAPIWQAWRVAARAHHGQVRQSGQPYITHPLEVARICAELGLDRDTVVAAILHDTVEDTPVTLAELRELFGDDVAVLVDGVTKLDQVGTGISRAHAKSETLRAMIVAMARDSRVLLVKLADRLHNCRTLSHTSRDKQVRIATETMDVFVPLAARLGVWELKSRLEDAAFAALDPDGHRAARLAIARTSPRSSRVLAEVGQALTAALTDAGIPAEVSGRTKSLWSAHRKAATRGVDIGQLHDLLGVRVIVGDAAELYRALGVVHATLPPVPGTFDDYVSVPKHNSYQSLHSTVMAASGDMVEIQLRTPEMHARAEAGVCAHWQYKSVDGITPDWVAPLADRVAASTDPDEFLAALKADLVRGEVFVFTRDGDALRLPSGATPIDVAYAVHTDVGNHCVGARVNGRSRPLRSRLASGDQVEVLTADDAPGPRADWLDAVVTPRARTEIGRQVKRRRRDADRDGGLRELRLVLGEQGLAETLLDGDALPAACRAVRGDSDVDRLLADVGTGDLHAGKVVAALVAASGTGRRIVTVTAVDRVGLLADAAGVLANLGVPIVAAATASADDGHARLTLTVTDHRAVDEAAGLLTGLHGVVAVEVA